MSAVHSKERLMSVVLGPHLSEKGTRVGERNHQVVFRVRRDSTKAEVRRAVEMLFEVKVSDVRVVNCMGKVKKSGRRLGRQQDWKKAYVSLAEGSDINFLGND